MIRKRVRGTGSVTSERGKHRVRLWINGKTKSCGYHADEQTAHEIADTATLERAEQKLGVMTPRKYWPTFLRKIADHKEINAVVSTGNSIILDAPWADDPIASIEPQHIGAWVDDLPKRMKRRSVLKNKVRTTVVLNEPISHKTAANALGYVQRMFYFARKGGHCTINPADGLRVPKDRQAIEEPVSWLSAEQIHAVLSYEQQPGKACEGDSKRAELELVALARRNLERRTVYTVAIGQCPRQGEIAGMDWDRVDWSLRRWRIAQSWEGSTKTGRTRWQELLPFAYIALREWWEHEGRPTIGIMFPSPQKEDDGSAKRYAKGYDWGWRDHPDGKAHRPGVRTLLGIADTHRFHDFRDTCGTHLLSGTWGPAWPIEAVSKHLGHRSIEITKQRYAFLTDAAMRKLADSVMLKAPELAAKPAAVISGNQRKAAKSLAPRAGLEPATNRLTDQRQPSQFLALAGNRQVCGKFDQALRDRAAELWARVAAGDDDVPDELVRAVLTLWLEQSGALETVDAALVRGPRALSVALRRAGDVLEAGGVALAPAPEPLASDERAFRSAGLEPRRRDGGR